MPSPPVVYHNPDCGTSRNVLALIREKGLEPSVVEYLKVGWTRPLLNQLLTEMGIGPRDLLRDKGTPAREMGLLNPDCTDEAILEAMVAHPILVNRPIVQMQGQTRLCRPSETVLDLL